MVAVEADLRVESPHIRMSCTASGSVVTCRFDGDAAGLFDTLKYSPQLIGLVRSAVPVLVRAGLRIDVVVGRVRIARAGRGVRQNALARVLRLPFAHLGS